MTESVKDWDDPYEPENCTNEQLRDDWRLFVATVSNIDDGLSYLTYEVVYYKAAACAREIARRVRSGKMQFTVSKEKSDAYQKLWRGVASRLKAWQIAVLTEGEEVEEDLLQPPGADAFAPPERELLPDRHVEVENAKCSATWVDTDDPLAPVNPSGVELGEEITLEQVLGYFKSFYRTKPYVSLIGGLCTRNRTKGDIDIFIRSAHHDLATEFRIIRMFPQQFWRRMSSSGTAARGLSRQSC
ncbi:MAG TPA: hypothetical protein ENN68_10120 [Methanomicrobia archaeon]|nr:hypothetical protein [Methanomicrobia archaeon]